MPKETPDFFSLLNPQAPLTDLHPALILLFDKILQTEGTESEKLHVLAQFRAKIDILLKEI